MNKTKIIVSDYSGFCFGVKRALDIAEKALKKRDTVYSLGPIIHNPQVVREFSGKGLKITRDIKGIKNRNTVLLVPSHGINPDLLKDKNITYVDTTCPLVGRVQKTVKDMREKGYFIVIVGNKKHPEVKGLKGIAGNNSRVIKDKKEAKASRLRSKKVALISQTTASVTAFEGVLSELAKKKLKELISFNTVCKNTTDRQEEARRIAGKVEAMVIIGGKQSANTTKLAKTCRKANRNTYHIESETDLRTDFLKGKKTIGIAAGASTPPSAIRETIKKIRRIER